jgi:thiamine biosynthesis lipoprotein
MIGSARFTALGTTAHLLLTDDSRIAAGEAELRDRLAAVDAACSRFRPDSALSRLVRHGGPAVVDDVLFDALAAALRAAELTGGLVDPTVGAALVAAGYDRDLADLPPAVDRGLADPAPDGPAPDGPVAVPGWRSVRLDPRLRTVTLAAGTGLDLGAIGKGWAADQAARRIARRTGAGVLVNLGGDLAVAGPVPDGGWRVRVARHHSGGPGPLVAVRAGGIATSSVDGRVWSRQGRRMHHIIDPATGRPAVTVWRSATVAAATCADASAAALAALLLAERAPDWLAGHGLPARLVRADTGAVATVAGWPGEPVDDLRRPA